MGYRSPNTPRPRRRDYVLASFVIGGLVVLAMGLMVLVRK